MRTPRTAVRIIGWLELSMRHARVFCDRDAAPRLPHQAQNTLMSILSSPFRSGRMALVSASRPVTSRTPATFVSFVPSVLVLFSPMNLGVVNRVLWSDSSQGKNQAHVDLNGEGMQRCDRCLLFWDGWSGRSRWTEQLRCLSCEWRVPHRSWCSGGLIRRVWERNCCTDFSR